MKEPEIQEGEVVRSQRLGIPVLVERIESPDYVWVTDEDGQDYETTLADLF